MSDNNYPPGEFANQTGLNVSNLTLQPEHPEQYDDIFKLSGITNSRFTTVTVVAGDCIENALDINNKSVGVLIHDFHLYGGKQCAVVVKGGSSVTLEQGLIGPNPTATYDIELGGWSDQSMEKSSLVLNATRRIDGQPLRVVCGWWSVPTCLGGTKIEIMWLKSIEYHIYNIFSWIKTKL